MSKIVLGFLILSLPLVAATCAESTPPPTPGGGTGGTSSQTGTGTGGGGNPTAAGGGGIAGGGEGGSSPCAQDCSAIVIEQPCLVAVCDEASGACVIQGADDGVACDDGLFCTVDDACSGGTCAGGAANDCGLADTGCNEPECDEASRSCTLVPAAEGSPCSPEALCVVNATCQSGACVGPPKDCTFAPVPPCAVSQCSLQTGNCEPVPGNQGAPCDPDNLCFVNGTCNNGTCTGFAKDCTPLQDACNGIGCNPGTGTCYRVPVPAGTPCPGDACDIMGSCVPG